MALTLKDRIAIQDLLVRYGYAIDVGCTEEEFLDLFTEDAVMLSPLSGVHKGVEGVKKFRNRHVVMWGKTQIRHVITNFVIDGDGDRATLKAYFLEYRTPLELTPPLTERKTEFLYVGTYDCVVRKINGKWKIQRRTVAVDHRS